MATSNLVFGTSLTIAQLKAIQGVDTVTISKNKETGAKFFACGAVRGPVSKTFDSSKDHLISNCTDTEEGTTFQMLHNVSLGEVVETL